MLEEAIDVFKRLRTKYPAEPPVTSKQLDMAVRLGIEAMERIQGVQEAYKEPNYFRTLHKLDLHTPLPSETEGELRQELPK